MEQSAILDAIAEGMGKVHAIFCQKGHALPLCHEEFVEARTIRCRNVEIVSPWDVFPFLEVEERQSQLQEGEIEGCFLDSLVKLPMVGEEPLHMLQLRDQTGKFAVKSHKMSRFDLCKDEVEVLVEVGTVYLHCANNIQFGWSIIAHTTAIGSNYSAIGIITLLIQLRLDQGSNYIVHLAATSRQGLFVAEGEVEEGHSEYHSQQ